MQLFSHFDLNNKQAYQSWRAGKYLSAPPALEKIRHDINDVTNPASDEITRISTSLELHNLAIFKISDTDNFKSDALKSLASRFGLVHADGNLYADQSAISEIQVIDKGRHGEYIPYTNKPLSWHTDGYYNSPSKTIRSFILYCQQDAATGGENQLLDPAQIYIHLRDENPAYIKALSQPDVLHIPETVEDRQLVRPAQSSAVFSIDSNSGQLLMRYTQRKRHIHWKQDAFTQQALERIHMLLSGECPSILKIRLQPGEGLICNNILHSREAFENSADKQRLYLRARYYDRAINQMI